MNDVKNSEAEVVETEEKITLTMTSLEAAQLGILASVGAQVINGSSAYSATHQQAVIDSVGTLERLSVLVAAEHSKVARKH